MNLKAKAYEQAHKQAAERKLAARLAILKAKGADDGAIARDALIKQIKADIRKAGFRLKTVAAQEKLLAAKAQAKADKIAARKQEKEQAQAPKAKKQAAPEPKKEKKPKAKKQAPAAAGE